jgi:outer membrane protein assembly factor BamB
MKFGWKRLLVALIAVSPFIVSGENWPAWRGPNSDGSTSEKDFPISWSTNSNIRWRVELPDRGNSSPIVWKDRVFITQADGKRRTVICVDRRNGKVLWDAGPTYDLPEITMEDSNPYCAASPVTDGTRVIAFFASAGVYCFDFNGKEIWHTDLGKISHRFGTASSPALAGDLCLVYVGPGDRHELVALQKKTGKIAWRSPAVKPTAEEMAKVTTNSPPFGSWSTPLIINNHGLKEAVMSLAFRFGSYDLANGNLLWESGGLGLQTYVTPLWTDGMLVAMSGTTAIAVHPPVKNEKEPTILWSEPRGKFRFGSGVSSGDHLFYLAENGLAECWEKKTGKVIWQERLQGSGKKNTTWSSLSIAGKNIYAPNQSGDVFVFEASPNFRMLSTNTVSEPTNASLALSQGNVIMRTDKALWCFER